MAQDASTKHAEPARQGAKPVKGTGRELDERQELACALRILAHAGWQENLSGHITWMHPDGETFWCNPWGVWWEETTASDIARVRLDGEVVEGEWGVSAAVFIHTELHRARPDARVIVHGHPYYTTLLGGLGIEPSIIHQNSSLFDGEIGFVDEYEGVVDDSDSGSRLAKAVGDATGVVLANHGGLITGSTVAEACYRSVTFERMCRFHYDSMLVGSEPRAIDPSIRAALKDGLQRGCPPVFWDGAVRGLLRREPDVLD